MSMYSYVKGLKPKTDDYEKRLQIYNLCTALNIPIPHEIESFFDGEVCEDGIVCDLPKDSIKKYCNDTREYFEVDLTKIPSDVTKVRFCNSW